MQEESQMAERVQEIIEPPTTGNCPVCKKEIRTDQETTNCDWCGLGFHEEHEPEMERCPRCRRYLPTYKAKALSKDRKRTAVLIILPFAIIELIIAVISWILHPSSLSVPEFDNWFSVGMIVNIILLLVALIVMGAVAGKGEGEKRVEKEEAGGDEVPA